MGKKKKKAIKVADYFKTKYNEMAVRTPIKIEVDTEGNIDNFVKNVLMKVLEYAQLDPKEGKGLQILKQIGSLKEGKAQFEFITNWMEKNIKNTPEFATMLKTINRVGGYEGFIGTDGKTDIDLMSGAIISDVGKGMDKGEGQEMIIMPDGSEVVRGGPEHNEYQRKMKLKAQG